MRWYRRGMVAVACAAALLGGVAARADEGEGAAYELPEPQKEHAWLEQLVGEWVSEGEIAGEPGQPPQKTQGTESGRMIGGFWALFENRGEAMGSDFTGILTIGYDPAKKKYIGTWVDSMTHQLWLYEGAVDETGKILTLEAEAPDPQHEGQTVRFRETIEIKDKDHKVFTSTMEQDGKWITLVTIHYRRKK